MTQSNPVAALYAAMAKAFPEIEGATKESNNPHFRSKYADLGNVVDAIKPALTAHGLWFRQATHDAQGGVCIETFICHQEGGEVSCGRLFVPASKNDAQGYGSALTYARRYSLQTAFGVAPEDDDGNAATKTAPAANASRQPAPREKMDGPYTSKTALKKAADDFYRDLLGCGDQDMLAALVTSPASKAVYAQLKREWPGYITGDGMPGDFEPIGDLIARLKRELPETDQMEAAE